MGKFIDLTNKRFGRWTVINRAPNGGKHVRWQSIRLTWFALLLILITVLDSPTAMATFTPLQFFEKNTTFFADFSEFRVQWFAVEDRISDIKDEYEPVDWEAIKNSAKEVVTKHEQLMVKFARDCRIARDKLPSEEVTQAQRAIEIMLEYLDSVGLVVLKLYEMSEKLYQKTLDPYSYTMEDYNTDFRQFKTLNKSFAKKGNEVNQLLYGKVVFHQSSIP